MTHNPRENETYNITPISTSDTKDTFKIEGDVNGYKLEGVLTIHHDKGHWDGYEWEGTNLNEDQIQEILDLFETNYEV